ncbi:acyl carrier protein [Roseibium salinum]|uniref:Acyl carrier protein n=1 Tax=Roseibium salinum TaxID=1604349 RepID=A0ABT3R9G3_9HYPH|nr:acyl carrier protein [Roseibium sp. DSM 29163]MCX2725792.1 acyl carrier protein [Roseibium sp. DSM 29163]
MSALATTGQNVFSNQPRPECYSRGPMRASRRTASTIVFSEKFPLEKSVFYLERTVPCAILWIPWKFSRPGEAGRVFGQPWHQYRRPRQEYPVAKGKIRDFIEDQFLIEFDETFPETSDLFKEGVVDSFGYIQLIRFLEKEFDIKFTEQEMTGGVMVSLEQIEQAVAKKVAERSQA